MVLGSCKQLIARCYLHLWWYFFHFHRHKTKVCVCVCVVHTIHCIHTSTWFEFTFTFTSVALHNTIAWPPPHSCPKKIKPSTREFYNNQTYTIFWNKTANRINSFKHLPIPKSRSREDHLFNCCATNLKRIAADYSRLPHTKGLPLKQNERLKHPLS